MLKTLSDFDYSVLGLGLGLALLPMRIGMVGSLIGWGLLVTVTLYLLVKRRASIGDKSLGIPLLALAILQNLQGVELQARVFPILLFGVYMVSTRASSKVFIPVGIISTLGGISLIIANLATGDRTGGFYHLTNYNIAMGAIILGAVLWRSKYQIAALTIAFIATIISGAEEALIAVCLLGIIYIITHWEAPTRITAKTAFGIVSLMIVAFISMIVSPYWDTMGNKVDAALAGDYQEATGKRLTGWKEAVTDITWLGHGYAPHGAGQNSIHSMPLIILYQTGIFGLALYCWVIGYGILKTKMKYAFLALFGLGLFDNYLWTQIPAYTYVIAGTANKEELCQEL